VFHISDTNTVQEPSFTPITACFPDAQGSATIYLLFENAAANSIPQYGKRESIRE
jgi:hypothetical protein